jgi:hypothetical protein
MKAGDLFALAIVCLLIYFLFKEAVKVCKEVTVEATPNGIKFSAFTHDELVADAAPRLVLQGN